MRHLIRVFDERYRLLNLRSVELVKSVPNEKLFVEPVTLYRPSEVFSFGELILRSAGTIEQTFGGITTRLWDDPFEWTLPEELSSGAKILEYFHDVELTRQRGFSQFKSDQDLYKKIPAPQDLRSLGELLIETISRAEEFYGRAWSVSRFISKGIPGQT